MDSEQSRRIWVGDCPVFVSQSGKGEPLVLLHGNGETHRIFAAQLPALSSRYRVIAMDTRGHGESGRGFAPLRFETFADDLRAVLDELRLPSAHLIGYSDGGNLALTFAAAYPERVRSLFLLGANTTPRATKPHYFLPMLFQYGLCSLTGLLDKSNLLQKEKLELMLKHPHLTMDRLCRITAPALVVAGDRDMFWEADSLRLASYLQNGRLCVLRGADHFAITRQPGRITRLMLGWLARDRDCIPF